MKRLRAICTRGTVVGGLLGALIGGLFGGPYGGLAGGSSAGFASASANTTAGTSVAPETSTAPATDTLRLTLGEAWKRAREASARLGSLRAQADAADAALRGARAARLPQLDLSAGYTRYSDVPEFAIAPPRDRPRDPLP